MLDFDAIIESTRSLDFTPMLLAIFVGGIIGIEREIHGRPAGFRTHILVCLSSTLLIQASQVAPASLPLSDASVSVVWDPNRLAAGVVTGIGFLGAAAVIRAGDIVRGITTGACVWSVAVLGVLLGRGAYGAALAGAVLMLGVLVLFDRALAWTSPVVYRRMKITVEERDLVDVRDEVCALLREQRISIQDVAGRRSADDQPTEPQELELRLRCRNRLQAPELLDLVCQLDGVRFAEWNTIQS